MSITVAEALKLKHFRHFNLHAGEWGLDNKIEKIGILDHEIVEELNGEFGKGDFVLTSFTPARNDIDLLIKSIQGLIQNNVSGLAIKNIYFKGLPPTIVELANKMSFPIFMFDESIYYEDVIAEINDEIKSKDNDELQATKIDILLKESLSKSVVRELALDLNHSFKENFLVAFCKEKKYVNNKHILKLLELYKFQTQQSIYHLVIKYRDGILIICSHDSNNTLLADTQAIIDGLGIKNDAFTVGISNMHKSLSQFAKGVHEAFYAVRASKKECQVSTYYKTIGIHQILLPFIENDWLKEYSTQLLTPIKNYDDKYHTQLFETAIAYVENDQSIKRTSEILFQHNNTIRYRLKKIKELLQMEHLEGSFNEQLSIAIKIYQLNQL